jgi:hypothetical protein
LLWESREIRRRHKSVSAASRIYREEHNNTSHTGGGIHRVLEPNKGEADQKNRGNRAQNLDSSFLSVVERGNIVPKAPEATLVAAEAYS